jgi:nucleoside-diphosphate-sugar epimerase
MNKPLVLITGATGFLGSHLCCLLLKQGYRVVALRRNSNPESLFNRVHEFYQLPSNYQPSWITGDILNVDDIIPALGGVSVVFHCAALVSFAQKDKQQLLEHNVVGTRNMVNACLKTGVKQFVYASSVAALGRATGDDDPITENSVWVESKYNSRYAISKYLAEQEVWRAQEEGLHVALVNPGIILGYGDSCSGSNKIYHMIKKGQSFYPVGSNGFVGVEDVAKMMLFLFEKNQWGKRFLCVAETIEYKKLFFQLCEAMGKKPPRIALNGAVLWLAYQLARAAEFLKIPFPIPSDNIITSSKTSIYQSVNQPLLDGFQYTPIRAVNYYALLALGLLHKDLINQNN